MTDLQASLIAIGGTIVAGVITYNKWQEYKAKKSVEKAFSSAHDDVLMAPGSTAHSESVTAQTEEDVDLVADIVGQEEQDMETHPSILHFDKATSPVDELIDCVIPMPLEKPIRGEKLIPVTQSLRHVGNKPVNFIGQREDGKWGAITHESIYTVLAAGVQLANRTSALNEIEYSELIMQLRQIGDEVGAEPDVPDMTDVMGAARKLHHFVSTYDAQLSVNVVSNGAPWAINTLLAALERQGFDLRPDGRLIMPDGDSGNLFSLSTNVTLAADTTSRLTLLLDVPCVAPLRDGLGAMVACAKSLAARLGGTVVDDTNHPLSDAALEEIVVQVHAFYGSMEAVQIPAGSTRALRLFS